MIFDKAFPRSLRHCLDEAAESLAWLAGEAEQSPPLRRLGALQSELRYGSEDNYLRADLHAALDSFQIKLLSVGEAIDEAFFSAPGPKLRSLAQDPKNQESQQQ